MRLAVLSASVAVLATAYATMLRLATVPVAPQAMAATLFLAAAAGACLRAAQGRRHMAPSAAALAAATATACGIAAGAARWPGSELGWLFALMYSWLAAQMAHLSTASRPLAGPILGAQTLPTGILVYGTHRTSCAWIGPDGAVHTASYPSGLAGTMRAWATLHREALIRPLLARQRPALLSVRSLHAAEHLAVLEATRGCVPDPETLSGNPITPMCGGTIAAIALPTYAAVSTISPPFLQAAALLWALCVAYALRTAASAVPRLRLLLIPGLWLQRFTTAEPGPRELQVACAAVAACIPADNPALDKPQFESLA